MERPNFKLDCRGKILHLSKRTHVMGILNVTPDSFYDGGRYFNPDVAIARGMQLAEEGADIIDIGAESTRPGSEAISLDEELQRLTPVVEALLEKVDVPISIDTYKAAVAEKMLQRGIHLINDISGLRFDPGMRHIVAQFGVPVVIMHIKGTPKDMQINPHYNDLLSEIKNYLSESINVALAAGIKSENIIIDPGIGFGKRLADNYELLRRLDELHDLFHPILIGPSRKSFIGKVLQLAPDDRLEGTAAAVALGIQRGADIVRVHEVEQMARVCRIADLIVGKTLLMS